MPILVVSIPNFLLLIFLISSLHGYSLQYRILSLEKADVPFSDLQDLFILQKKNYNPVSFSKAQFLPVFP